MKRYLLSIYQPDGPPPADVDLEKVMVEIATLIDDTLSRDVVALGHDLVDIHRAA